MFSCKGSGTADALISIDELRTALAPPLAPCACNPEASWLCEPCRAALEARQPAAEEPRPDLFRPLSRDEFDRRVNAPDDGSIRAALEQGERERGAYFEPDAPGSEGEAPGRFVIEFRSGTFFQNMEAENGGPCGTAQRFATRDEAERFMEKHDWILFNGGMVVDTGKATPKGVG
jgi:hypothetical protein